MTDEFLGEETHPANEVHEELRRLPVAGAMRDAGKANRVILTRSPDETPLLLVESLVRPRVVPPRS